jgi:hypothetical protein
MPTTDRDPLKPMTIKLTEHGRELLAFLTARDGSQAKAIEKALELSAREPYRSALTKRTK